MTEKIIEFECVYGTARFSGYCAVEDLDDDEPLLFYDINNQPQAHLGNAHFTGTEEDQNKLYEGFTGDFLFIQFLADFADENITIDREDYTLIINEGTQLEMKVEQNDDWDITGNYLNAKISFKFGDTILDDDLLESLCDDIAGTWNAEGIYKTLPGENAICLEIDNEWWDEELYDKLYSIENKRDIEKEMLRAAEIIFVRQLIMDKGVYAEYQRLIMDKGVYAEYQRGAANNYEQILECENIEDLNNICEKELQERIIEDIKEDY